MNFVTPFRIKKNKKRKAILLVMALASAKNDNGKRNGHDLVVGLMTWMRIIQKMLIDISLL